MSTKKVYVVSGALWYPRTGELHQDLAKVHARKRDALRDLAGRVRERLADGVNCPGARKVDREEFERCVVDGNGDVFGWNVDAVEIE